MSIWAAVFVLFTLVSAALAIAPQLNPVAINSSALKDYTSWSLTFNEASGTFFTPAILSGKQFFLEVDLAGGIVQNRSLANVRAVMFRSGLIDPGRDVFAFTGKDMISEESKFLVLDLSSSNLEARHVTINSSLQAILGFALNTVDGCVYSYAWDSNRTKEYLLRMTITADSSVVSPENIGEIPGAAYVVPWSAALDSVNQRYAFVGRSSLADPDSVYIVSFNRVAVLNVTTITSPSYRSLFGLTFDEPAGDLYAFGQDIQKILHHVRVDMETLATVDTPVDLTKPDVSVVNMGDVRNYHARSFPNRTSLYATFDSFSTTVPSPLSYFCSFVWAYTTAPMRIVGTITRGIRATKNPSGQYHDCRYHSPAAAPLPTGDRVYYARVTAVNGFGSFAVGMSPSAVLFDGLPTTGAVQAHRQDL
eukprot:TRINITY_DN12379_c0_g1_i1.p1 TRINITY_DN12379_c0_g1~~TRINITY_DN12379_c0_g1_i1.p1  ORF type:complete len:420 (+),score=38.23 TRINITY_DN12379_c0_g1_i1:63-1322(+)